MTVLLCPGQGAQKVGMARDLAERFPAAREMLARLDSALGFPLSRLMAEGPEEELTRTDNAQPAILAHTVAVFTVVRERLGPVSAAAGHSLGEYSAYVTAGTLSPEAAARLVRRRGELMLEAGARRPGTMAAVLGLGEADVDAACQEAAVEGMVVAANLNAPDQTVISGEPAAVQAAGERCKARGARRVLPLKVSGAFHSPLMAPAVDGLHDALAAVPFTDPAFPVVANASGELVRTSADAKRLLTDQLTAPVRWVGCMRTAAKLGDDIRFVELGPGSVLSGLARKILPGANTVSLGTADEVEQFLA